MAETHSTFMGYLLWIFGFTGAHRFYYGRPISGTIYFFTLGLLFIGWIVSFTDNDFLIFQDQIIVDICAVWFQVPALDDHCSQMLISGQDGSGATQSLFRCCYFLMSQLCQLIAIGGQDGDFADELSAQFCKAGTTEQRLAGC